ncbi:alpha-amylase family glycosyl hydrolase [Jatrophihabitans telluris]|uniref:alpha-amylase family glycosyl hydrolase n=1 Tax=Jatrophihabitans telluris TaxID=2038343 RepID=UPI003221912F
MTDWVEHAVHWQVYPLGFLAAPTTEGSDSSTVQHRLPRLAGWLDYAVELGASVVQLGPIFAAESHGYDTVDHFRIDPRLGDEHDFDSFVLAAHERGVRVVLDGVFNHVGRSHPAFRSASTGDDSPYADWFIRDRDGSYRTFEGHSHLVVLNHDNPAVADYVASVLDHWLDRGADGWRLDAAYAVPPSFWARVLPAVRSRHHQAWFVGEVIHGDYLATVAESGLDSLTQYELWKALWSSINDANFFELAWALKRHNEFLDRFAPLTFLGNHDVTRIASRLGDSRHLAHALVLLFTLGGVPSVYYGDEQAFRAVKQERAGGDDEIRPAFPDSPEALSPLGVDVFRLHQDLIGLRRRHSWLHRARTSELSLANKQLSLAVSAGENRLVVALNLDDATTELAAGETAAVLLASAPEAAVPLHRSSDGSGTTVTIEPHGWAILA